MRFLHTGDIHIGALPEGGKPWAKERRDAIKTVLPRIIELANKEDVDLLLIAGDLFHKKPLQRELKETAYAFSKLARARVVLIAGNHDHLTEGCAYASFDFGKNVTFLTSEKMSSVYFKKYNAEVHGFSYHSSEITEPVYDKLTAPKDGRMHILLAHGGDESHIPIRKPMLAGSGYDYIALGHIHQPQIFKGTNMAFCGCPEPLDRTDAGARGVILGELDDKGLRLMWRPICLSEYRNVEVTADTDMTQGALEDAVKNIIDAHPKDLYNVRIIGERASDLDIDTDALMQIDRVCSAVDETSPHYDLDRLAAEHTNDLISHYIKALNVPDATPQMKNALFIGLRALLKQ